MKNLKKSMFLTTVLMVVLLVVALSTATFAWFSASNSVVTQTSSIAAATSSSANLTFSYDSAVDNNDGAITIDLGGTAIGETIAPMIPVAVPALAVAAVDQTPAIDATAFSAFIGADAFNSALLKKDNSGADIFHSITKPTPWKVVGDGTVTPTNSAFYVLNKNSGGAAQNVTVSAAITAASGIDSSAALRIAVFANGKYVGTLAKEASAKTFYGALTPDALASSLTTSYNCVSSINLGDIAQNGNIQIQLAVWNDGTLLNITNAGGISKFALTFTADA